MEGESLPFLFIMPFVEQNVLHVWGLGYEIFVFAFYCVSGNRNRYIPIFRKSDWYFADSSIHDSDWHYRRSSCKKQGTEVYYKVQRDLQYGKMPGEAIADGLCIFIGGLLLMLPGFLSDLAGACLLIPFTRGWCKPILFKWLRGMSKNKRIIIK